jgi:hypothetical protein
VPSEGLHVALPQRYGPGNRVVAIDKDAKSVTLASGVVISYEALVSTMPLDLTLRSLGKADWADGLMHRCLSTRSLPLFIHSLSVCLSALHRAQAPWMMAFGSIY